MLITPKGLIKEEFLCGEDSLGLCLLHDFIESSRDLMILNFLMSALDGAENKVHVIKKL